MIRQDKFKVGDKVRFITEDVVGSSIVEDGKKRHGPEPYVVEEIEEMASHFRSVGHTQIICINGERYSGWWFQPTESAAVD